jgi:hypothetical protein
MTPREKAIQLYEKFYYVIPSTVDDDFQDYSAKQCALIAVDEILNNDGFTRFDQYLTEYWQQVKQEIQVL